MSDELHFTVYGQAEPAGSKRAVTWRARDGRSGTNVVDANPKAAGWKKQVAQEAGKLMQGKELMEGPLAVTFEFFIPRPKGHYGKRGLLPSAPAYPTTRPDVGKLSRGTCDALTGVVWRDDAQLVTDVQRKRFGSPARVEIHVRQITQPPVDLEPEQFSLAQSVPSVAAGTHKEAE